MLASLYQLLVAIALDPAVFIPYNGNRRQKRANSRRLAGFLVATAGVAVVSLVAYRFYRQQTNVH
jgi:hypothetical protein